MLRGYRLAAAYSLLWLALAIAALAGPVPGAEDKAVIVPRDRPQPAAGLEGPGTFRAESSLVLIPVHVTTPLGSSVTDLTRDNFRILADNVPQTISLLATDDAPMSIGLLFDASGSMKNKRRKVIEAAAAFFRTANRDDEFFLVEFNERARLVVPFTSDIEALTAHIAHTHPFGETALLDAFHVAVRHMKKARNMRKALVVLSDGGDNWSRHNPREVRTELLESDVQVYAMGIFEDPGSRGRLTPEERGGPDLLDGLAANTGGRLYVVNDPDDLPAIATRISRELRTQYLLGFTPTHFSRDGKYRRIQVQLSVPASMPDLRVYYRPGYYDAAR